VSAQRREQSSGGRVRLVPLQFLAALTVLAGVLLGLGRATGTS
jgi:hypothetical protein